jgi:vacuolar-type H+-ATPase subunit F/Vma7
MAQNEASSRVAMVADKYLATGFRLTGVASFPVRDAQEAAATLERILLEDKYDVIIITEKLSMALRKERAAILAKGKGRPAIAIIPDFEGPTGERLQELHTLVSRSVGAELKFES